MCSPLVRGTKRIYMCKPVGKMTCCNLLIGYSRIGSQVIGWAPVGMSQGDTENCKYSKLQDIWRTMRKLFCAKFNSFCRVIAKLS